MYVEELMEIIRSDQSIQVTKPDGTGVNYYIFSEYEIHYNEVPPGTIQAWHHHNVIEETLLMVLGELEARWKDGDQEKKTRITKGDLVRVENTPHTFANVSDELAIFVIVRLILEGSDKHEQIKNDKHLE